MEACEAETAPTLDELQQAMILFPEARSILEAQILLLTKAWMSQTDVVGECRLQFRSIQKWARQRSELET